MIKHTARGKFEKESKLKIRFKLFLTQQIDYQL